MSLAEYKWCFLIVPECVGEGGRKTNVAQQARTLAHSQLLIWTRRSAKLLMTPSNGLAAAAVHPCRDALPRQPAGSRVARFQKEPPASLSFPIKDQGKCAHRRPFRCNMTRPRFPLPPSLPPPAWMDISTHATLFVGDQSVQGGKAKKLFSLNPASLRAPMSRARAAAAAMAAGLLCRCAAMQGPQFLSPATRVKKRQGACQRSMEGDELSAVATSRPDTAPASTCSCTPCDTTRRSREPIEHLLICCAFCTCSSLGVGRGNAASQKCDLHEAGPVSTAPRNCGFSTRKIPPTSPRARVVRM